MRTQWKIWAIAIGAAFALGAAVYMVRGTHGMNLQQTLVPGTGVSLALPNDVVASPFGTTFVNKDSSIIVGVMSGSSAHNPLKEGIFQKAFSPSIETFHSATLEGTLLHRTRKLDGGGWDGWVLFVVRGARMLSVQISYQGTKEAPLGELRKILDTVSWDEHIVDPELAFGLRINPPGLRLVPGTIGGLDYSADGHVSTYEPYLTVFPGPIRSNGDPQIFHQLCEKLAGIYFKGRLPAPLQYTTTKGILLCDTHGDSVQQDPDYYATIEFPDGAIATSWGRGNPDGLRQSLLDAKRIPR